MESGTALAMLLIANQFGVPARGDDAESLWRLVSDSLLTGLLAERG